MRIAEEVGEQATDESLFPRRSASIVGKSSVVRLTAPQTAMTVAASRGEIGGHNSRLMTEISRQTLNFAFGVALLEERRVDSFGDLDRGVGLRSEDRHPDRLGPELAGFGVVRLAPSEAVVVVAGAARVASHWIRLGVELRAEREAVDDVIWNWAALREGPWRVVARWEREKQERRRRIRKEFGEPAVRRVQSRGQLVGRQIRHVWPSNCNR